MAPVQTELVRRAQKHQGHRAGDNTHCDYLYTSKLVPVQGRLITGEPVMCWAVSASPGQTFSTKQHHERRSVTM